VKTLFLAVAATAVLSQSAAPTFEVASIRQNWVKNDRSDSNTRAEGNFPATTIDEADPRHEMVPTGSLAV